MQTIESDKGIARFWAKVNKKGPDDCWPWTACVDRHGYGTFVIGRSKKRAHRVSFELCHRALSPGECALHKCDNPPCCNPAHLWAGSLKDNMIDMASKGRDGATMHPDRVARGDRHKSRTMPESTLRGEDVASAKLTEKDVRAIRKLRSEGHSSTLIAKTFRVDRRTIDRIRRRELWAHIP
jgi:hypothetical protein